MAPAPLAKQHYLQISLYSVTTREDWRFAETHRGAYGPRGRTN